MCSVEKDITRKILNDDPRYVIKDTRVLDVISFFCISHHAIYNFKLYEKSITKLNETHS